nr:MAG TPA: hypothetical protein [Bacteriophage sp.]
MIYIELLSSEKYYLQIVNLKKLGDCYLQSPNLFNIFPFLYIFI